MGPIMKIHTLSVQQKQRQRHILACLIGFALGGVMPSWLVIDQIKRPLLLLRGCLVLWYELHLWSDVTEASTWIPSPTLFGAHGSLFNINPISLFMGPFPYSILWRGSLTNYILLKYFGLLVWMQATLRLYLRLKLFKM